MPQFVPSRSEWETRLPFRPPQAGGDRRRAALGSAWCVRPRYRLRPRTPTGSDPNGAMPVPSWRWTGRAAAGGSPRIDAFIDLFGPEYVELAIELGIPRDRIETITAFEKAQELGVKAERQRYRINSRGPYRNGGTSRVGTIDPMGDCIHSIRWSMLSKNSNIATLEARSCSSPDGATVIGHMRCATVSLGARGAPECRIGRFKYSSTSF